MVRFGQAGNVTPNHALQSGPVRYSLYGIGTVLEEVVAESVADAASLPRLLGTLPFQRAGEPKGINMPLFTRELNALADRIGLSDLTIRLHTAAPTNASPTNGRVNSGGGLFVSGANLPASGITDAANWRHHERCNDIDFGTAVAGRRDGDALERLPGQRIRWLSARLPSTVISHRGLVQDQRADARLQRLDFLSREAEDVNAPGAPGAGGEV